MQPIDIILMPIVIRNPTDMCNLMDKHLFKLYKKIPE